MQTEKHHTYFQYHKYGNANSNNCTISELFASACKIPQVDMVPGLQRDMRFEGLEDSF